MRTVLVILVLATLVAGVSAEPVPPPKEIESNPPAKPAVGGGCSYTPKEDGEDVLSTPEGEKPNDDIFRLQREAVAALMGARQAERRGDEEVAKVYRTKVVRLTKVIRQRLSPAEFAQLMGNYGGPASPEMRPEVENALASGLLKGRRRGATANDNEWQAPDKREELAAGLNRTLGAAKADAKEKVKAHDTDSNAHAGLFAGLRDEIRSAGRLGAIAFWLLMAILAALLLWGLWRLLQGGGVPANVPVLAWRGRAGAPAAGPAPVVPPAGSAANVGRLATS